MSINENVLFTGGWDQFKIWTAWLVSGGYIPNTKKHLRKTGEAVRDLIRGHIIFEDMGWKPLSKYTIRQKGHGVVYVETSRYTRHIRVHMTKRDYGAIVNILPGKHTYQRSGKSAAEIAFINEYGGAKIPARPLWRPVFMEMQSLDEIANVPIGEIMELHQWAH